MRQRFVLGLRHHPRQVFAVRPHARQHGLVAVGCVQRQQFPQCQRRGPTVQQDVMVGEHDAVPAGHRLDHHQPHQRGRGHVELFGPVRRQHLLEAFENLQAIDPAEVHLGEGKFHTILYHRNSGAVAVGDERGAEVGVPVQHGLPRPT